jgi:hypothetical protein
MAEASTVDRRPEEPHTEDFMRLGTWSGTHVFLHVVKFPDKLAAVPFPIQPQVFNALIHHKFVADDTEQCVVFSVDPIGPRCTVHHITMHLDASKPAATTEKYRKLLAGILQGSVDVSQRVLVMVFRHADHGLYPVTCPIPRSILAVDPTHWQFEEPVHRYRTTKRPLV